VHPVSPRFAANIDYFDRLCRVVKGMKSMVVGAIGARTTAFKTVRIDELALQRHGITMETVDLADVFARMSALSATDPRLLAKAESLRRYTSWTGVPEAALETLAKLGVVLDILIEEFGMQALAVRCWVEMQKQLHISPCVLLSEMNERGVVASCEVDVSNAIAMYGLSRASGTVAACLDWNNNYRDEDDKCILFHCGPVPQTMMASRGQITDHLILVNVVGRGCGYGCNTGRIAPTPFTFGSLLTEAGKLKLYLGQGRFTADPIPEHYFGCAGVGEIGNLQDALQTIGSQGHRHHVSVTPAHVAAPVREAFAKYLGYEVTSV
jgi:L-fucose isomerase-like protein